MNRLLIIALSFLFFVGFISIAWAHGPHGNNYRSYSHSKPHSSRPSNPRSGIGNQQRHRHSRHLPRIENGIIVSKSGPIQSKTLRNSRTKSFSPGFGASPLRKALQRKGLQQVPRHSHSSHSYYHDNPEPWFLYGKGKEFRQMGLIPPLPLTSQSFR